MGQLVVWWLVLEGLGLMALPLVSVMFSKRTEYGYAFGKIVALLVITYDAWLLGHLGIAYSTALLLSAAIFLALNVFLFARNRATLLEWLGADGLRAIVRTDVLWTLGFAFFAWQRSLLPQIVDQEKYMDFAFFNTLIRTDTMPPQDPWMAGKVFNYYYFGYLMLANLARCTAIAAPVAYNLCVATLGGLVFSELAAIGLVLTRKLPFALLTGAMGILFGNLDGFLQFIEKGGLTAFDYFRSTRIVGKDATINEFPYFTAIHGDLHPHFQVMPVMILLLALLLDPERERGNLKSYSGLWPWFVISFVLGAMVAISTWELPVGAMTTFLLLHRFLPLKPFITRERIGLVVAVVAILIGGYVLFLPFYLNFTAPGAGVGVKFAITSLGEFLTVFGGLLMAPGLFLALRVGPKLSANPERRQLLAAMVVLAVVAALMAGNAVFVILLALVIAAVIGTYATDDAEERAPILLMLAASAALLACELIYIKDPYGERLYRMNTVFKLYLQSWFLLALATPWALQRLLTARELPNAVRTTASTVIVAFLLASCLYPLGVTVTRLEHPLGPRSLDGNEYMKRDHPDDFAAVEWIRSNVSGLPVLLEASGNPYSYFARMSSNTGLPTIMGWGNHEGLWRNNHADVGQRQQEVARIYNAPALADVTPLLERYKVEYIVVGELERKEYAATGLEKFNVLKTAFKQGRTTVYQR